ncbi:MAG: pyridoxamine 5'-phosphate oxidase family protein, partial [Actinomycetota bacterium]|nr:pyridoxamine 5'-phosphate oxidase family protein [Actinomycetota bacterium]
DFEDVSVFVLTSERELTLIDKQTECVFMWATSEGDAVGVVMNYVFHDGRFWLTGSGQRKRFVALARRPRAAVAITSRGTDIGVSQSVTYKGPVVLHDDDDTKAWFYPALAARVRPDNAEHQAGFVKFLDSPRRIVIELIPEARIGFDAENMFVDTGAGPSRTKV